MIPSNFIHNEHNNVVQIANQTPKKSGSCKQYSLYICGTLLTIGAVAACMSRSDSGSIFKATAYIFSMLVCIERGSKFFNTISNSIKHFNQAKNTIGSNQENNTKPLPIIRHGEEESLETMYEERLQEGSYLQKSVEKPNFPPIINDYFV